MHFVELNKRQYMDQNEELYAWTEFLKAPNSEYLKSRKSELKTIFNAKEIFDKAIADPIQREKIRLLEKTQMDNQSSIAKAHEDGMKKGLQKGKEEGLAAAHEEGLQQGKEAGLAEGLEKGQKEGEHNAKVETARNMLKDGLTQEVVAKYTGLSVEEIEALR